jgi:hypothetical protein
VARLPNPVVFEKSALHPSSLFAKAAAGHNSFASLRAVGDNATHPDAADRDHAPSVKEVSHCSEQKI